MPSSIYEEIGGTSGLTAVVEALYERLLADPGLLAYFEGCDVDGLKSHQRAMLTVALGGPSEEYGGRMMHAAHAGLAITQEAFDKMLDHLAAALTGADVPSATSGKILAILRPLRTDVVTADMAVVR